MPKKSIVGLVAAVAMLAILVIGPTATATTERTAAGTVVIAHDQEPGSTLNPFLSEGNGYTVNMVVNKILANGADYDDKVRLTPELLEGLPKLVKQNPLVATATYKKNAVWSDGKPITGADFLATYRVIMNPNWDIVSRQGWEDIQKIQVKGKSFTVTFKKGRSYFAWEELLGEQIVPAHKVAGQDFNKLWATSVDIASGPFKFGSWQKGTQLTLVKNPAYKAGPAPKLDRIVVRYLAGPPQFQALKGGEADIVEPQPQVQIVDFYKDSKFKVQAGAGYQWEHVDFQQGAKAHPALKQKYVRQAIITGINRAQIREVLYIKTGLIQNPKDLPVLQSHIWKPFEADYTPSFSRWKFSQRNAIAMLKKNGCTGGPDTPSSGNSKIWTCPNVGQLSFDFTTTSGNPLRALAFEIMQKQLKSIGIEFKPRFLSPAVLFGGGTLSNGDWQIVMFTFLGGPTSAGTFADIQGCGGDQNYMNACNRQATTLLAKAKYTADAKARGELLRQAEKILADEVYSVPLFARPVFLLNNTKVSNVIKNPTQRGMTWNANLWSTVG